MLPAKAPSGLPVIDTTWGGLYCGGAYLVHGRAQSGNRLLALQLAQAAVEAGETCLFASLSPPDVLASRAAHLGFDAERHEASQRLRLLHVAPVSAEPTDDALEQALADLTSLVRDYAPSRLVIDDFAPFTRFETFERFADAFFTLLDRLTGATLILAMHTSADAPAGHVVEFVQAQMTGLIELSHSPSAAPGSCTLVLRPGRFHAEGARVQNWTFGPLPQPPEAVQPEAVQPEAVQPEAVHRLARQPLVPTLLPGARLATLAVASMMGDAPGPPDSDGPPGIHFFDFGEDDRRAPGAPSPGPPSASPDFSAEPPSEPSRLVDPFAVDPFAYALTDRTPPSPPASPLFSALPTFLARPPEPGLRTSMPRRDFGRAFEAALVLHEAAAASFLVLGLRMKAGSPAARDFPLVVRGMRVALGDTYALLADADRLRLVALLPGGAPEEAPTLFADLKQFLYDVTPEADVAFAETSAVLLPNGRPFHTAEAFLAYAFDD